MSTIVQSMKLYKHDKKGKVRICIFEVHEFEDNTAQLYWQYGLETGVHTPRIQSFTKPRGKKTATDLAIARMESRAKDYIAKGYIDQDNPNSKLTGLLPMLASLYKSFPHTELGYMYVQPKIDGVRCTIQHGVPYSRKGKVLRHIDTIVNEALTLGLDTIDGELYHPKQHLLVGLLNTKGDLTPDYVDILKDVTYKVYDTLDLDLIYNDRLDKLCDAFESTDIELKYVSLLETEVVYSESELMDYFSLYLDKKYEGIIIRDPLGLYTPGDRGKELIKLKPEEDAEFQILDIIDTETNEGKAIFVFKTEDGRPFKVNPSCDEEMKEELYNNKQEYIGKWVTVMYRGKTEYNTPKHATTKKDWSMFRDIEL